MTITYAISFADYRALQPPFVLRPGFNAGFKGFLAICSLIALLGVFCIIKGLGISTGGFLIGLGTASVSLAYFYDKRSVSRAKEKHENNLSVAYQRIHCRENRTLEANETGFTMTCKCGSVMRPWSEFIRFSENNFLFLVGTKTEGHLVPKSAFSSEGEITRFRALFLERLTSDRPITARPIQFKFSPKDFRDARILHLIKGGGWRRLITNLAAMCISAYGAYVIWSYLSPHQDPALLCAMLAALLGVPLVRSLRLKRKRYMGPQRVYFTEEGLHVQDLTAIARNNWAHFIGYLEGNNVFLVYHNRHIYRIIPRRALADREGEFRALLSAKLRPYNYRIPEVHSL